MAGASSASFPRTYIQGATICYHGGSPLVASQLAAASVAAAVPAAAHVGWTGIAAAVESSAASVRSDQQKKRTLPYVQGGVDLYNRKSSRDASRIKGGPQLGVRTHLPQPPRGKSSGDAMSPGMETRLSTRCRSGSTTRDARHPNVDLLKCYKHKQRAKICVFLFVYARLFFLKSVFCPGLRRWLSYLGDVERLGNVRVDVIPEVSQTSCKPREARHGGLWCADAAVRRCCELEMCYFFIRASSSSKKVFQ